MKILVNNSTGAAILAQPGAATPPGHQIVEVPYASAPPSPWLYSDGTLVTAPARTVVPRSVPGWKAKAVLESAGLLQAAQDAIAAIEGDAGIAVRNAWAASAAFDRNGPTLLALASSLGLTEEQIDNMFLQADAIRV